MSRRPAPLPAGFGAPFRTGEALAAGVSRGRLAAADLEAPFHGVRMPREQPPGEPDTAPFARDRAIRRRVLLLARAYARVMPTGAAFVGRTAGVLLGLPLEHGEALEVGVLAPARAPRGHGVRGTKVEPHLASFGTAAGLPVSSPATTWAMLARSLSVRELIVVGDAVVQVPRDGSGIPRPQARRATCQQLAAAVAAGARPGLGRLREALREIRVGSMSPLETEHRLDASAAGLPEPELDVEIRDEAGRLLGISEFVHREWRVAVEIEGDHHRVDRRQWNRDIDKYAAYAAAGWEVVRLTAAHVRSARGIALVRAALLRRGWSG